MISSSDRQNILSLINEHISMGGRRTTACKILGINQSTYFRWKKEFEISGTTFDARFTAHHTEPAITFSWKFVNKKMIVENS